MTNLIVDAQVHEPSIAGDWSDVDARTRSRVLTEALFAYLDAAGVDAALLHPTIEFEWAERVARENPERVACVLRWLPGPNGSDIDRFMQARADGWLAGVRLILGLPRTGEEADRYREGGYDHVLETCQANGVPVFVYATWNLDLIPDMARRYPELRIVVDHLGIPQPPLQVLDAPRFKAIDDALNLARFSNVAVKLCGAPGLSVEPYPFGDVWPYVARYVEAFGAGRLIWGSDISRFDGRIGFQWKEGVPRGAYPGRHSYRESLSFIRDAEGLSLEQKHLILGGAAVRLLDWPPEMSDIHLR